MDADDAPAHRIPLSTDLDAPVGPPEFSWRRAPIELADRLGVRPATVLGTVAAIVAAVVTAWWALRPPPPPPEDSLPVVGAVPLVSSTSTSTVPVVLVVHVDGAVGRPGVHEVRAGARVIDAVDAAGGLLPTADRRRLNLAQLLADGQRVWVPAVGDPDSPEPVIGGEPGGGSAASGGGGVLGGLAGPVSLSTAGVEGLQALPGIGPSLAAAIVEHRDREGPFRAIDDLLAVSGIGPAKLDAIRDLVAP